MKRFTACLAVLAFASVAVAEETSPEPKELVNLRSKYERAVKAAVDPLTRDYVTDLTALMKRLGIQGDAKGMMVVQNEIERVNTTMAATKKADAIVGDWVWFNGVHVEFFSDGTLRTADGLSGTWKVVDKRKRVYRTEMSNNACHSLTLSNNGQSLAGNHLTGEQVGLKFTVVRKSK